MTEAPAQPRQPPGKRVSFALAVLIHAVLAVMIVYGVHWQTRSTEVVEVDLVPAVLPAPTPVPAPPAPQAEPRPEPRPAPQPEPPKRTPQPPPKPDIVQKERPAPKPAPAPAPAPPPDPFQEQLEREAEQLQRQKAAAAAAQEIADLRAQQTRAAQAGELDRYVAAIRAKVRGNIVLPGDMRGNPEAVFEVTQLPSGEILNVKLKKSSGNATWDHATERAILKSSPLPKPAQAGLFRRTLELRFRPQED